MRPQRARCSAALLSFALRRHRSFDALEVHALDAPAPNALHHEPIRSVHHRLTVLRHSTPQLVYESADPRDLFHRKIAAESFGELVERDASRHPEMILALLDDFGLLDVVLI